jgi:hypothetical protein
MVNNALLQYQYSLWYDECNRILVALAIFDARALVKAVSFNDRAQKLA